MDISMIVLIIASVCFSTVTDTSGRSALYHWRYSSFLWWTTYQKYASEHYDSPKSCGGKTEKGTWWEALNVIAANLSTDDEETMECHLKSQQESPKAQCVQTFLWKKQKQQKQITVTTEYSHSFNTYVLVLFILSLKTCN